VEEAGDIVVEETKSRMAISWAPWEIQATQEIGVIFCAAPPFPLFICLFVYLFVEPFVCLGTGDLICRLVIGPLITVLKLDVTKLYAISQIPFAIKIASFPTVVNCVQVIIQGFLFSVTFGCQCLFLGNLLQWSNESAFDFVPLNLMVLSFSSRSACAFRKWKFESNLRRLYVFLRDWHSYWSTDRKYLFILLFEIIVSCNS
jgi:hypothetical protein